VSWAFWVKRVEWRVFPVPGVPAFLALYHNMHRLKLTSDQDDGVLTWMVRCHLVYSSDIIQARGAHSLHPKISNSG